LGAQAAEVFEEDGNVVSGECGGGFVEDEDAGLLVDRADNFDELLLADAEFVDGEFGGNRESEVGEEHGGAAVHFEPIDAQAERAAARGATEENVFGDAQFIDERELLGDDGDAGGLGVAD
jgi:hypothetical protein